MAAPLGNQYTRKFTLEEAMELFIRALEYAETNPDCLCVQDAEIHVKIPHSTFGYLCNEHKVLDDIKADINRAIIAKVNKGALDGTYNTTAGIWRMKQLGEKDVVGHDMSVSYERKLTDEEKQSIIGKL